jgi:hypothetical protein
MPYNAHKVFENQSVKPSFSKGIALPDIETNELRAARDVLRAAISGGLRNWASVVRRDDAFTEEVTLPEHYTLRPRFRMQGSHKYYTHIAPAHRPPQQADMDDGLFLPVLYFGELTDQRPALLSDAYFNLIETIIQPVCEERGWTLKKKSTCIRVELSDEQHVDMALYSIPERQLRTLTEEIAKRRDDVSFDTPVLDEEVYRSLASGEIMLAHREQGWKRSDPRKLEDWFQSAMDRHGSQLRRVCRYLKAWRDNVWQKGGPSSIALMYVAVAAYDQGEFEEGRDDKALLSVAEAMPGLLASQLPNPVVDGEFLDDGWGEERQDFIAEAQRLAQNVSDAIMASNGPDHTIELLQSVLGPRVPEDVTLVETDGAAPSEAGKLAAPSILGSTLYSAEAVSKAREAAEEMKSSVSPGSRPWAE